MALALPLLALLAAPLAALLSGAPVIIPLSTEPIPRLAVSLRPWVSGGPCARNDFKCMNAQAFMYINVIRAHASVHALEMGTESMLANAMKHSIAMQKTNDIFHQNLSTTDLGCNSYFSAENVVQTYIPFNMSLPSDPAKVCVAQFKHYKRHYENIVSPDYRQTAIGIYVDDSDYIWCTQTFAVNTRYGSGKCARANSAIGGGSTGSSRSSPSPSPASATPTAPPASDLHTRGLVIPMVSSKGYLFENFVFLGLFPDGRTARYKLRYFEKTKTCAYCTKASFMDSKPCISEDESVKLDKRISSMIKG